MALFWRIWTAVTLVNLLVLGVFVGLAALQFASINSTLVGERLIVLGTRTVAPFAAAIRLGLPLETVRNATALLERARQTDEDIVALHVFDADGRIVHSTASSPPAKIQPETAAARAAARGEPWYRQTRDGFVGSVDIVGRDGSSAGGILIVYPGGENLTQVRAMAAELLLGAIATLLLAGLLGTLLLRRGLAGVIRHFDEIDAAYRDFEHGAWRRAAGRPQSSASPVPDASDGSVLRARLETAAARYRATGQELAALQKDGA